MPAVLAVTACQPATQITVDIETDVACDQLGGVALYIAGPDEVESLAAPTAETTSCDQGRVGDIVVVPKAADDSRWGLRVVAGVGGPASDCQPPDYVSDDGTGCIVARRSMAFLPHQALVLPVSLRESCLGVICTPGYTCVDGGCARSDIVNSSACLGDGCGEEELPVCSQAHECSGDVNDDGAVTGSDALVVQAAFGSVCGGEGYDPRADLDGDGTVGNADLGVVLARVGCACPSSCPGDANDDGDITFADFLSVSEALGGVCGDENYIAAADFDGDGTVELFDFALLDANMSCACDTLCECDHLVAECPGDFNRDNQVDLADVSLMSRSIGSSCGDANFLASADRDGDGDVDSDDVALVQDLIGLPCPTQ